MSSWNQRVVEHLFESIERLEKEFSSPVRVVGQKNSGLIKSKMLLGVPSDERA